MKNVIRIATVAGSMGIVGTATAQYNITPVAVEASSEWDPTAGWQKPIQMIDSSGLSGVAPNEVHDDHEWAWTMWHSAGNAVADEWVVFDLGAPFDLTNGHVWQMNQNNNTGRGVALMDVYVSSDNIAWTLASGSVSLLEASGFPGEPAQAFALAATGVQFVKFDIQRSVSGNTNEWVGLSEVRFEGESAGGCYADCDTSTGVGVLDIFDFLCFQDSFVASDPYACDCDTSTGLGVCDIFDFLCFQDAFVAGCP